MAAEVRVMGISLEHPHGRDRLTGARSSARLNLTVGKSPTIRHVVLADEDDQTGLIKLLEQGITALRILNSE